MTRRENEQSEKEQRQNEQCKWKWKCMFYSNINEQSENAGLKCFACKGKENAEQMQCAYMNKYKKSNHALTLMIQPPSCTSIRNLIIETMF